ncbi:MAG: tetratricopeptide repeat protein, partial [Bdellovibrionales bacterium]
WPDANKKSPAKMAIVPLREASVVTNHLISRSFANDQTNQFRIRELTSAVREKRGMERLKALPQAQSRDEAVLQVLSILRDKGVDAYGQPLNLGNRQAIDSLIATHSVIYNPIDGVFYVSEGPAVAGPFQGFDLKESFRTRHPVRVGTLPADPLVTPATFNAIKEANLKISRAHRSIHFKQCKEGMKLLDEIDKEWKEQSPFYAALGDGQECLGNHDEARAAWTRALALNPAYERFVQQLERNLQK